MKKQLSDFVILNPSSLQSIKGGSSFSRGFHRGRRVMRKIIKKYGWW